MRKRPAPLLAFVAFLAAILLVPSTPSAQAIRWERAFYGTAQLSSGTPASRRPAAMLPGGDLVVASNIQDDVPADATRGVVTRYAAGDGALVWSRRVDAANGARLSPMAIAVGPDGNPVLAGIAPRAEPWTYDLIVVKLSASDGSRMFESVPGNDPYGGGDAFDLALDNAGNPAVLFSHVAANAPATMRVTKFAATDGSRLWSSELPALTGDRPEHARLAVDANGNLTAAAAIFGWTGEWRVIAGRLAAADGSIGWSRTVPGAWSVAGLAVSAAHEALIALVEPSPGGSETQVRFARLAAANGSTACEIATTLGAYAANRFGMGRAFAYDGTSFVVAGASRASINQNFLTRVIKFGASTCALAWSVERGFGPGTGDKILLAAALDGAGDVLVAGEPRGITAKLAAADGALLWSAFESERAPDEATAILVGANGDPFWVGTSSIFGSGQPFDVRTMRLAGSTGTVTWTRAAPPQPGPTATSAWSAIPRVYPHSAMRSLARGGQGPVYLGGAYFDGARQRPFVVALDAVSGARAWSVFDPSDTASGGDEGTEVIVAGGGGDAVAARAANGLSRRAAATGAELWRTGVTDALAVPPDGDLRSFLSIVVPPPLPGLPPLYTVSTQRLAAGNGATLWSDTLNLGGEFGGRLEARDIATSVNGTSYSLSARPFASDPDGFVVAHAADGTRLWAANYTAGLAGRNDDPFAVAAGPDGDPVVAGRTDMGTNWNCLVQKFAAATGALRWSRNYDRGYGGHDECYALAVTPEGDVVAAGMAHAPTGEYGLLTLKLSGVDGSVLWSVLEPGVAVIASAIHAVAIDPVGQVVVAGYKNNGAAWDLAVRRYAAATGAEFWRVDRASAAWSDSPGAALVVQGDGVYLAYMTRAPNLPVAVTALKLATRAASITTLTSTAATVPFGQPVVLTVAISGATPGGTATIREGATPLPGCVDLPLVPDGVGLAVANCTPLPLPIGTHVLVADYGGDLVNAPSSGTWTQTVAGTPCAGFADVEAGSPFCGNVEWIVNRGITYGCAPGLFCPTASVVRLAMAAFMNRMGAGIAPRIVQVESAPGALDPDAEPIACMTADSPVEDFPARAAVDAVFTAMAAAEVAFEVEPVASFDGGATWLPLASQSPRASVPAGRWANVRVVGAADLAAGASVRFALRVTRADAGAGSFADSRCQIRVRIGSRDGASSPY
jgi:hypothetical protein